MSSPWTPEQREWLLALGHSVFTLAGSEDRAEDGEVPRLAEAGPRQDMPPHAPVPSSLAAPAPPVHAPAPVSPVRPARPSPPPAPLAGEATRTPPVPGRMGDPLYRALLRATARRTPREGESVLQSLEAFDPDADDLDVLVDALRADPARKRALWLQLRAARKAGRR